MMNAISALRTTIESHLKNLEKDGRYKFFKEKDEVLLTAKVFLAENPIKKLSGLSNEHLQHTLATYTEVENTLQGLINA